MTEQNRTWLIRHPNQTFSRPIPESELLEKFGNGGMDPKDEICAGSSYWFSVQDIKEMRKHFGNMPLDQLFKKQTDEVTQERFADTAPIVVPVAQAVKSTLKPSPAPNPAPAPVVHAAPVQTIEQPIQKSSPMMKIMLLILTIAVLILLFVWFG